MKMNIGGVDRLIRVVIGVLLIGIAVFDRIGPWGISASCRLPPH